MFEVGQTIYQKVGKLKGQVLEVSGSTVYIEMSNGVEAEFDIKDMTDIKPVSNDIAAPRNPGTVHQSIVKVSDFTAEHQRVFDSIPDLVKNAVGVMYERLPFSGKWSALNNAQKLNLICAFTRTPYEQVKKYCEDTATMSIIMAHGIGQTIGITA